MCPMVGTRGEPREGGGPSVRMRTLLAVVSASAMIAAGTVAIDVPASASSARVARPSGPAAEFVVLARDATSHRGGRTGRQGGRRDGRQNGCRYRRADRPSAGERVHRRRRCRSSDCRRRPRPAHRRRPGAAPVRDKVENEGRASGRQALRRAPKREPKGSGVPFGTDTFEPLQWDMQMIRADQARTVNAGSPKVLVGVIDTGIDASHPTSRRTSTSRCPATSPRTSRASTDPARSHRARTRPSSTTVATAPMSQAPSPPAPTVSAWSAWLPRCNW